MSFLKKWAKSIKKYLFTYKDGFFVFPIFNADPEQLAQGLMSTPKVKYSPNKKHASTRTLFMNADTYILHLEDGLWIVYTSIVFKKNICFEMIYDPEKINNYYTLAVDTSITAKDSKHYSKQGRYIENQRYYWRLVKPGTLTSNYNLAGTKSNIISLYIGKGWFEEHFLNPLNKNSEIIRWHENPENEVIFFPNSSIARIASVDAIFNQFENQDENAIDFLELKSNIFALLSAFTNELKESEIISRNLKPKNEAKVLKAEQLLKEASSDKFPTIKVLAKKVGLSETKLKADFKAIYGKTIFQYYSETQMDLAEEMLRATDMPINEIAYSLGYSHAGKFSSAFKKIKHISPSHLRKDQLDRSIE